MAERTLTDSDITAIVEGIHNVHRESCRFSMISEEDLLETVKFAKSANQAMAADKTVVRQTLIKMGLYGSGFILLLGISAWVVKMAATKGGP